MSASFAELYSWTDREGNSHVTDDRSKVPAEYRGQASARQVPDEETEEEKGGNAPKTRPKKQVEKKAEKMSQSETEPTDNYGRGEDYWRERAEALRQNIEDLQQEYESVCSEQRACEKRLSIYVGRHADCSRFEVEKDHIERAIEWTKKLLDVDLPDEARKAGAYPGWVRELKPWL